LIFCQSLLALLEEEDPILQAHALKEIYAVLDQCWAEVANSIPLIEELSEDPEFQVSDGGGPSLVLRTYGLLRRRENSQLP
jgi:hypothetical protein